MENKINIVEYLPEHRSRFKEINIQWITKSFVMEEEDIKTVDDPEGYIIRPGGKIFIALYNNEVVGTCGYQNFGEDGFEMIKMAVDENYRGLKIGKIIGEESLKKMKAYGAKRIFLFSNTKGSAAAVQLYYRLGFKEIPLGNADFQRADIKMELFFSSL
jgi:ribosomal protein S18 acetylase RimI-like enzyme